MGSTLDLGGFVMVLRSDVLDLLQSGDFPFCLATWFALNSIANLQRATAAEVSLSELQRQTSISKPKLIATLDTLEARGFIRISRKGATHFGRPVNRYVLLKGRYTTSANPKSIPEAEDDP